MKKTVKLILTVLLIVINFNLKVEADVTNNEESTPQVKHNVVAYAHFKDETARPIKKGSNEYNRLINVYDDTKDSDYKLSFPGYIDTISFGKLKVESYMPQNQGGDIVPIKLSMTKESTKGKYVDEQVIKDVVNSLNEMYPDYSIPSLDTLTIIIQNDDESTTKQYPTIWSHQHEYKGAKLKLFKNHNIYDYNFIDEHSVLNALSGSGVVAHEFLHGQAHLPDLYPQNQEIKYVGAWDIMGYATFAVQHPLAIFKGKDFLNWISIDEITSSTSNNTLVLPDNPDGNQALIIKSPINNYEYFVVEYRKNNDGKFFELDQKIPGTGLVVYRIDTTVKSFGNNHRDIGTLVFRKDRTSFDNESLNGSFYTSGETVGLEDLEKTYSDGALTYSDGSNSGIVINNINVTDTNLTFDVQIPDSSTLDLWENTNYPDNNASNVSSVDYNGDLYVAHYENNKLILNTLDDTTNNWNSLSNTNLPNTDYHQLFIYKNKLYLGYVSFKTSSKICLDKYDFTTNTWTSIVSEYDDHANDLNFFIDNNELYLSYPYSNYETNVFSLKLAKIDTESKSVTAISNKDLGSENNSAIGANKTFVIGNEINFVTSYKNKLTQFTYNKDNSTWIEKIINNSSINTFDLLTLNNISYLVIGGDNLKLFKISNNELTELTVLNQSSFDPVLAITSGNLYVMNSTNDSGSDKYSYVYRYDVENNMLVQEGIKLDLQISKGNLISDNDSLYATYVIDDKVVVKKKEVNEKLVSITITEPTKLVYTVGEAVVENGLTVTANYTSSSRVLKRDEYDIENYNTCTAGLDKIATVIFKQGKMSKSFVYDVIEEQKEVISISIKTNPTKVTYQHNEATSLNGLSITVTYSDDITKDVIYNNTDFVVTNFSTNNVGIYKATVSYKGKVTMFEYAVIEKEEVKPSVIPTVTPPTVVPTVRPTIKPTVTPPTVVPTVRPTIKPTVSPTVKPTTSPIVTPTEKPVIKEAKSINYQLEKVQHSYNDDENIKVIVDILDNLKEEELGKLQEKLVLDYKSKLISINIYDRKNDVYLQPTNKLEVYIPYSEIGEDANKESVYHVYTEHESIISDVDYEIREDGISLYVDKLSYFVINYKNSEIEDKGNNNLLIIVMGLLFTGLVGTYFIINKSKNEE